jgi:hypothetical protein
MLSTNISKYAIQSVQRKYLLVIGIVATNIRGGGGVTHLVELLSALNTLDYGIDKIVVWGCKFTWNKQTTLAALCAN